MLQWMQVTFGRLISYFIKGNLSLFSAMDRQTLAFEVVIWNKSVLDNPLIEIDSCQKGMYIISIDYENIVNPFKIINK